MLDRALPSSKISTVLATVWTGQERLEEILLVSLTDKLSANKAKLAKVKLNCHSDIGALLNIAKCLKIDGRIFEIVKLSMRDRS